MVSTKKTNEQHPLQKQAWDYFALHGAQRLTTFNFYLVVSGIVTAGMVATFAKDYRMPLLGVILGVLLTFFSFVFRQLDNRNRYFIKNAEAAMRVFESISPSLDHDGEDQVKLFTIEYQDAAPLIGHYSYSKCFLLIFWAFGVIGVVGAVLSVYLFCSSPA